MEIRGLFFWKKKSLFWKKVKFLIFRFFWQKNAKNGQKRPKKGKKPRFFRLFSEIPVVSCGEGGMSDLAFFKNNLINVLFLPQNPNRPTLRRETILTTFFDFFGPQKIATFRVFRQKLTFFGKKCIFGGTNRPTFLVPRALTEDFFRGSRKMKIRYFYSSLFE